MGVDNDQAATAPLSVQPGLAHVAYTGPTGGPVGTTLEEGDVATFGASGECDIRFGYAPVRDRSVPGVAGRLLAIASRVIVECAETSGYRALEVRAPGEPAHLVPLGEAFSPRSRDFFILLPGSSSRCWRMDVAVRRRSIPRGQAPERTGLDPVDLTAKERLLLQHYAAPLSCGQVEPATHREVSTAMGIDYNTARARLYTIAGKFFAAELPIPDVTDKRVAVIECARVHRLLDDTTGHHRD